MRSPFYKWLAFLSQSDHKAPGSTLDSSFSSPLLHLSVYRLQQGALCFSSSYGLLDRYHSNELVRWPISAQKSILQLHNLGKILSPEVSIPIGHLGCSVSCDCPCLAVVNTARTQPSVQEVPVRVERNAPAPALYFADTYRL